MTIHVEIDRVVLHGIAVNHADRRALLAAVQRAVTEQLSGAGPLGHIEARVQPVLHADPIRLPAHGRAAARLDALATGIAGAAGMAMAPVTTGKT
jgi:hypothetical protein